MPIEIRELVIRATVAPSAAEAASCGDPSQAKEQSRQPAQAEGDLVQSCVREVLRILEEKRER